jgi:hypothetical protein
VKLGCGGRDDRLGRRDDGLADGDGPADADVGVADGLGDAEPAGLAGRSGAPVHSARSVGVPRLAASAIRLATSVTRLPMTRARMPPMSGWTAACLATGTP